MSYGFLTRDIISFSIKPRILCRMYKYTVPSDWFGVNCKCVGNQTRLNKKALVNALFVCVGCLITQPRSCSRTTINRFWAIYAKRGVKDTRGTFKLIIEKYIDNAIGILKFSLSNFFRFWQLRDLDNLRV